MNRRKRTEILIKGDQNIAEKLALEINKNYEVKVVQESENGLVMVKMREAAQKSLFYLGEVLITEAKVQINEELGIGIVSGNKPDLAYYLAVIDAAYNANIKETSKWNTLLQEEQIRINNEIQNQQLNILKTKVNFETMDM